MQVTRQQLNTGWRFQDIPQTGASPTTRLPWLPAEVPGHVHLDLLRAGAIPDPFYRLNERAVAWVDETDWVYETTFQVEAPAPPHAYLVFHGLDTVAEITLNGEPLGQTDNMFIPYEFPVGGRLKLGDNTLRVVFRSALRIGRERHQAWDAAGNDTAKPEWFFWGPKSFVRKAQYMYGWDWGPELLGCGLWQGVELVTVPVARITDWKYDVEFMDDDKVVVTVTVDVERALGEEGTSLILYANIPAFSTHRNDVRGVLSRFPIKNHPISKQQSSTSVPHGTGTIKASVVLTITDAHRWQTIGKDFIPLYLLDFRISAEGLGPLEFRKAKIGLRTIELIREADTDNAVREFGFASEDDVIQARANDLGLQFVDLSKMVVDSAALKKVPEFIAKRLNILPLRLDSSSTPNRLFVALGDVKSAPQELEEIKQVSGCKITSALATGTEIADAIIRAYADVGNAESSTVPIQQGQVDRNQASNNTGEGFKFRVNGQDLFIKGANWIPDSSFPSRITREKLHQRITQAKEAGFNMLRVWGGGLYESEDFYDICDELGLLVWQDFPYACAYYPDTGEYADAARAEAAAAVKRIRNHPCLALWCGNNENQTMNHDDWGKIKGPRLLGEHFYDTILPEVVAQHNPKTPYWPGSPYGGENPNSADFGDCHNWDVWHGRGDWVHYTENDSRFCSEFGFASSCGLAAWDKCLATEDKHPHSPAVRWHDKTRKGYDIYLGYIALHYPEAQTLEDLVYYSQINQAEALKFGVEHYRRRKGRCWGTLFWQLNDCWPTQSWAVIDSEGEPKAAYYACKKFYAPALLSLVRESETVTAHLVNDLLTPLTGQITWTLATFDGELLATETAAVSVDANVAAQVAAFSIAAATGQERDVYVSARFTSEDGIVSADNLLWLAEPKDLRLADPGLTVTIHSQDEYAYAVTITAKRFAPYVWLRRSDNVPLLGIEDNFFHLQPGETRTLTVAKDDTLKTADELRGRILARTL